MPTNNSDKNKDKNKNKTPIPETAKNDGRPSTAATTATTTQDEGKANESSLLSRIQNSAFALIQDSLTKTGGGATLSSDLAHVLESGNKPHASSSSASFSGSTYSGQSWTRSNGLGNGNSSSSAGGRQDDYASGLGSDGGFRSTHTNNPAEGDLEYEFFQHTGGFFQTEERDSFVPEISTKGEGKGKRREQPIPHDYRYNQDKYEQQDMMAPLDTNDEYESSHFNAYEIAWINASRLGTVYRSTPTSQRLSQSGIRPSTTQTQSRNENENENDGAEVVSLLSDPSFQPGLITRDDDQLDDNEMDTSNTTREGLGFDLDDDPLDIEGFPYALAKGPSPAEIQMIDLFGRQQQPYFHNPPTDQKQQQQQQKKITPYSLVPDIDSFLATTTDNSTNDEALRNEVITNLIGAGEWLTVDERYNDEVWGYLRPAVEAAAAEIKQKEETTAREGDDGDGPAVKRLKMILRHMARL